MTEAEWITGADLPQQLFGLGGFTEGQFQGNAEVGNQTVQVQTGRDLLGKRKARLLCVAVCRPLWPWLTDPRSRRALEVAELHADGIASEWDLEVGAESALAVSRATNPPGAIGSEVSGIAAAAVAMALSPDAFGAALHAPSQCVLALATVASAAAAEAARTAARLEGRSSSTVRRRGKAAFWAAYREVQAATTKHQIGLLHDLVGNPFRPVVWNAALLTPTVATLAQTIYDERAFDLLPILADAMEDTGCTDAGLLDHLRGPGPHVRGCWALDLVLAKS